MTFYILDICHKSCLPARVFRLAVSVSVDGGTIVRAARIGRGAEGVGNLIGWEF